MKANSFNIIVRLQHWMDSVPGQTFLNYAYSWGASIVILGALFKLTHLYGADIMLFIGMGTEVVVFFLSAFDRPFDKTDDTPDLPEEDELEAEGEGTTEGEEATAENGAAATGGIPVAGGGTIIIGGGVAGAGTGSVAAASGAAEAATGAGTTIIGGGAPAAGAAATAADAGMAVAGAGATAAVAGTVADTSVIDAATAVSKDMPDVMQSYLDKLRDLTEVLSKVEEQSRKMSTDREEMVNLNRTLTGINTVYELQLKSISAQIGTIDQINEQTRHMAQQIEELNAMYGRMIKALTINMRNAASAQAAAAEP